MFRDSDNPLAILNTLGFMGWMAYDAEQFELAAQCAQEMVAIAYERGDPSNTNPHMLLSITSQALGDYEAARRHLHASLRNSIQRGMSPGEGLVTAAILAARTGQPERAVELVALIMGHQVIRYVFQRRIERIRDELRDHLSPDVFDAAWKRGEALDLDATAREILNELESDINLPDD